MRLLPTLVRLLTITALLAVSSAAQTVSTPDELSAALKAANAAPTTPSTITLAAGTYVLTKALPALAANQIILRGPAAGSRAILEAENLATGVIFNVTADQVTISNIALRNARVHAIAIHPGADQGRIESCAFSNSAAPVPSTAAINGNGCANWTITGNSVSNVAGVSATAEPAIHFYGGASGTTITNNLILNCDRAILLGGNPAPVGPTISQQPLNATVNAGQIATFSVVAFGTPPPVYQWRRNGVAIAGAASATYTTPATTNSDNSAAYSVVISNSAGSATSENAILSVSTTAVMPGGNVTHGEQLTINHVGPWTLQGVAKGAETLSTLDPAGKRLSNWPGWGRPSWIPGTAYIYNNNLNNQGGVVPAGGMLIDGYFVPGGTWVCQFRNFTDGVIIEGDCAGVADAWPGVVFRGCRMRGNWTSPGWFNTNAVSNGGTIWIMYCDAGGIGYAPPNICESIFESQGNGPRDHFYCLRSYLSIATTLAFGRNSGDAFIENVGESVIPYYNDTTYHMNGLANSGGQTATLWLRNRLLFDPKPGQSPYNSPQNDVIQMAADAGAYPGTGTNIDGSQGYQIRDNYLAGADHTLQLGVDKSNTAADVSHVVITGNKFSTYWFPMSGNTAISYKNPTWGIQGNTWSNNTWADDYGTGTGQIGRQYSTGNGPRKGQPISAP